MFRRICKDCEEYFIPTGIRQKLCDKCRKKPKHTGGSPKKIMCIKKVEPKLKEKSRMCFGKENRFNISSYICMKCDDYSQCKIKIYSKLPKNVIIINVKGKRKGGR